MGNSKRVSRIEVQKVEYTLPKVIFIMIRNKEQIRKVFGRWNEVPYKHPFIDLKKLKEIVQ